MFITLSKASVYRNGIKGDSIKIVQPNNTKIFIKQSTYRPAQWQRCLGRGTSALVHRIGAWISVPVLSMLCCPVWAQTLWLAYHSSNEFHRTSVNWLRNQKWRPKASQGCSRAVCISTCFLSFPCIFHSTVYFLPFYTFSLVLSFLHFLP
jgi:hypothetical protein